PVDAQSELLEIREGSRTMCPAAKDRGPVVLKRPCEELASVPRQVIDEHHHPALLEDAARLRLVLVRLTAVDHPSELAGRHEEIEGLEHLVRVLGPEIEDDPCTGGRRPVAGAPETVPIVPRLQVEDLSIEDPAVDGHVVPLELRLPELLPGEVHRSVAEP